MGSIAKTAMLAAAVMIVTGCANITPPNWCRPGTARQQQFEAEQYDPYPENDVGTPVIGGRPRGYTNPPAETLRARWPLVKQPGQAYPPVGR
jgi:hypothetical protein